MRVGKNPGKWVESVPQPADVTATTVVYIPSLTGYFEQSLEILKICLYSMRQNADCEFDLMVFDNGSCQEVREFLVSLRDDGFIQYLILSEKNVGKVGAWNFMFGSAPGKYVAFCDSDVFFYLGWISRQLEILETFPDAGPVCGDPRRRDPSKLNTILARAEADATITVEAGRFVPQEWCNQHILSLGRDVKEYERETADLKDFRLTRDGVSAYASGGHYQFMCKAEYLRKIFPLDNFRPVGRNELLFDAAVDKLGSLRLSTTERYARHIGNVLTPEWQEKAAELNLALSTKKLAAQAGFLNRMAHTRLVERILMGVYTRIFRLYYGG